MSPTQIEEPSAPPPWRISQRPMGWRPPNHYTCHPCPALPHLLKVPYHRWPVAIRCRQDLTQVFEQGDRSERPGVVLKGPLHALPRLLFCQTPSLPFHSLGTLSGGDVPPVQSLLGQHNVTPREPWVGEISLLQYYHGVPDIPVYEVYTHFCLSMPHPSKIFRHMYLSKASYTLCRSRKIMYKTSSLMEANCWSSLASRAEVPVPRPSRKPWRN